MVVKGSLPGATFVPICLPRAVARALLVEGRPALAGGGVHEDEVTLIFTGGDAVPRAFMVRRQTSAG